MNIKRSHTFWAFIALLAAVVGLAIFGNQELGGTLQVIDGLMGALLIAVGAVFGAQKPID